jgi:hypothetical protein
MSYTGVRFALKLIVKIVVKYNVRAVTRKYVRMI